MQDIPVTDQWLREGNCEKCRRSKFCSKPCKASQSFQMNQAVREGMKIAATVLQPMIERHEQKYGYGSLYDQKQNPQKYAAGQKNKQEAPK